MKNQASPKSLLAIVAVQLGMLLFFVYYTFIGGQTAQGIYDDGWRQATIWLTTSIFSGWLFWRLIRREPWPRTPLDYPLLGLLLAWGLSTLTSINPVYSRETLYFFISYLFFFYLAADMARRAWLTDLILNAVIAVSGMVWTLGLWQLSQWYQAIPPLPPEIIFNRLPRLSVLGNPNTLAAYIALVIPVVLYKLAAARLRLTRLLLALWLLMLLTTALLTQSRGGNLGLAVGLAFLGAGWLVRKMGANPRRWAAMLAHAGRGRLWLTGAALVGGAGLLLGVILSRRGFEAAVDVRMQVGLGALKTLLAHPLTGAGPGALGQALLQYPLPLNTIWPDAHNLFLTMIAETGLIGAAALLYLIVVAARLAWQAVSRSESAAGLAVLAGLVGFTAHNLLDSMFKFPLVMLLVAVWAGVWVSPFVSVQPNTRRLWLGWAVAAGLLIANTWLGLTGLPNITLYNQAVAAAGRGDWSAAHQHLQQAAALTPEMPFYQRQLGLTVGFLPAADESYRAEAIGHYRAALAQVDRLAEDHANLACLLWAAGQREAAIAEMTLARDLEPHNVVYRLNLGEYLEATGRGAAAQAEYAALLARRPELLQSGFWRQTGVRAAAAQTELKIATSNNPGEAYRRLSQIALAQNQPDLADRQAQMALFYAKSAENYFQAGAVAEARGRFDDAVAYYESAFATLTPASPERLTRYASEVARRRPLPAGYLPCLRQIYPDDLLRDISMAEADLWQRQGQPDRAEAVLARLRRLTAQTPAP
jgi:tetratricopeptide (TPR) repeat protein/O-antigen ligase